MTTIPRQPQVLNLPPLQREANPEFLRRENTQDGRLIAERVSLKRGHSGFRLAHVTLAHGDDRVRLRHLPPSTLRQMAEFCLAIANELDSGWYQVPRRP